MSNKTKALALFVGVFIVVFGLSQSRLNAQKSVELEYQWGSPYGSGRGVALPASGESAPAAPSAPSRPAGSSGPTGGSPSGSGPVAPVVSYCPCTTAANSCGMTSMTSVVCGSASCGVPPLDSSCPAPSIGIDNTVTSISAITTSGNEFRQWARRGSSCSFPVSVSPTTGCKLTGPGIAGSTSVPSSPMPVTVTTPVLGTASTPGTSKYTFTCNNGSVVTSSVTLVCQMLPEYNER